MRYFYGSKYQFTGEQKVVEYRVDPNIFSEEKKFVLNRIRAIRSFGNVTAGDLGGWIYSEANISHDVAAWVFDDAYVSDKAVVCDNAQVLGETSVTSRSKVCDKSSVGMDSEVSDNALVMGRSNIWYNVIVTDSAIVEDSDFFLLLTFMTMQ